MLTRLFTNYCIKWICLRFRTIKNLSGEFLGTFSNQEDVGAHRQ